MSAQQHPGKVWIADQGGALATMQRLRIARDVLIYLYRRRCGEPELLMLRRAPDRGDFWHWVSGAPEPGESDRAAAIREVLEETGLDVAATIFPLGYRYAYPLRPERRERWLELYGPGVTQIPVETFAALTPADWEPTLDDEHVAYAWCSFTEAERRLSWPGDTGTLDHLRATLAVLRRALL
jgi:dATP pyrophosphohydrolase